MMFEYPAPYGNAADQVATKVGECQCPRPRAKSALRILAGLSENLRAELRNLSSVSGAEKRPGRFNTGSRSAGKQQAA